MTGQQPDRSNRWTRLAVVAVGVVLAVWVLFTWVFPWITELGLSPAIE